MEVSELLESVDIVDLISQYVELEEKGGEYWGISPFTKPPEKTPSFSVRRETGRFYDFSSGIGGTAITFLKNIKNISSREAISILEEYAGVEPCDRSKKEKMGVTLTCKRFSRRPQSKKTGKHTVLPQDVMLQYVDNEQAFDVWRREGISDASLRRFQVKYDPFSNRLVYPIRSPTGEIVNIGGRTLDPDYKSKNIRKYTYFYSWGTMDTIYGLAENRDAIEEKREIILFEGCKSVLIADTWGIRNTGAILTSHLNPNQMRILIKLGVRVVFALDEGIFIPDDRNITRLKDYTNVDYLYDKSGLLSEKDAPVDKGREVFDQLYEGRIRYR